MSKEPRRRTPGSSNGRNGSSGIAKSEEQTCWLIFILP